jgi:hypothetical protein
MDSPTRRNFIASAIAITALAAVPAGIFAESREEKAARFIRESGKTTHSNCCATSLAPAEEPGPCDCGELRNITEILDYDGTPSGEEFQWIRLRGLEAVKNGQMFRVLSAAEQYGFKRGEHIPMGNSGGISNGWYGIAVEDGSLEREVREDSPNCGNLQGCVMADFYDTFDGAMVAYKERWSIA